jgi:hypothetical protein
MTVTTSAFETAAQVRRILKDAKLDSKPERLEPSVLE